MSDLKATLDALSEAATPGEWRVVTPPADWDKGGIWLSADPKYEYASEIVGMHCCCCGEGGFADGDDAIFVTRLVNAFRTGQLIVKPEREVVRERVALAILNSDRAMAGFPPMDSRDNIPDSDGYVVNADAALTAIFGDDHA